MEYITRVANELTSKIRTRDPFKICGALDIRVRYKDLGADIKAYYFYQSRIRSIVINSRVSPVIRRVLAAHELGHDRLHREIAMRRGFQETELFTTAHPTEYEANVFAAELLIDDGELLGLLAQEDSSFYGAARELHVPAALLDFKLRILKHKGYRVEAPHIGNGDFLKNRLQGCYDNDSEAGAP